jgi:pyridoxal phosphate enzyme (YggS family)
MDKNRIEQSIENLKNFRNHITDNKVTLVAVSKTHPADAISALYQVGQRHFGENKVQELTDKAEQLPKDILWHLIGHLQTNKVKYIVDFVYLIHSVDSQKLLKEINKQAEKINRKVSVLLQVYIAKEESKFGLDEAELNEIIEQYLGGSYPFVQVCGLMGMSTNTDNTETIRAEFQYLKTLFVNLKIQHFSTDENFSQLSMGMSSDYQIAIEEGSTMIRVGSTIFGARG